MSSAKKKAGNIFLVLLFGWAKRELPHSLAYGGALRPHVAFTNRRNSFMRTKFVAGRKCATSAEMGQFGTELSYISEIQFTRKRE